MATTSAPTDAISPPPSPRTSIKTKTTLWFWPSGLYPRRLTYYFSAKRLSLSDLSAHNIHLIPITVDPTTRKLQSKDGYETRPPGYSFPVLRIESPNKEPFWIHESSAILEYFEDLFPSSKGYEEMIGHTPEQRARTRDILSLLNDAIVWTNVLTRHMDPNSLSWSGMKGLEEQSPAAAIDANRVLHDKMLNRLEGWVWEDIVERACSSLSGEGIRVSLADVGIMAMVQYVEEKVGRDWLDGRHDVLRGWVERMKGGEWFIEKGRIQIIESENEGLRRLFAE